jgi:SNF2 family DNA or RNA helicase
MHFRPVQQYTFDWLASHPRAIVALQQRIGKTAPTIVDIVPPANVLCPAFLKGYWERQIRTWRPDLEPRILYNGDRARDGGNVWITNYEILQDTLIAEGVTLVADECHYVAGYESKRTVTTLALAEIAERVRFLSGTVMPNRSMELWAPARAVRATKLDYEAFGIRYAGGWRDRWNEWHFRENTNTAELKALIKPYVLRILRDQLGMPENDWSVIPLDLDVAAGEREVRRDYSLDAIGAMSNPLKTCEGLAEILHHQGIAKTPLIGEYAHNCLRDEGPILLFAWHQDVIADLATNLRQRGHSVATITGATSYTQRDWIVEQFQAGTIDVLVANRKAAGVGLPLHRAERVIFGEGAWNDADLQQPADRSVSMDKPLSVPIDILTITGSIDEYMVRRCLEKQGIHDSIFEPDQEFSQWLNRQKNPRLQQLRQRLSLPGRFARAQ